MSVLKTNEELLNKLNEILHKYSNDSSALISLIKSLCLFINNDKRMFNYSDLYINLLEKNLSDEEFDAELDKEILPNENDYVVPFGIFDYPKEHLSILFDVAKLLDYKYIDDLTSYFGISSKTFEDLM